MHLISTLVKYFATSIEVILVTSFIDGMGAFAVVCMCVITMSEVTSGKFREITTGYLPFVSSILPLYC